MLPLSNTVFDVLVLRQNMDIHYVCEINFNNMMIIINSQLCCFWMLHYQWSNVGN
jgi:hypothetical protein